MNNLVKSVPLLSALVKEKYSNRTAIGMFLTKLKTGLLACLSVCGFSSHSSIFHSYGEVTVTGERLHILT